MAMELFLYNSAAFNDFMQHNSHEAGEVKFLESIVKEGMNVIDIGANIGITTVAVAKRIGGGKLYSFEPVPEYFGILQKNLSANELENTEAFQLAVTDRLETIDFYQQGGFSGIIPAQGAKKFRANTTTIDRFLSDEKIDRIDLINMDCEGSELLVLREAKETLRKNKMKIFCEIHHDFLKQLGQSIGDLVKYLQSLEFEVQSVSLNDVKVGNNFEKCDYIYAYNLNEGKNYTRLRL